jgi:hypothetical protein
MSQELVWEYRRLAIPLHSIKGEDREALLVEQLIAAIQNLNQPNGVGWQLVRVARENVAQDQRSWQVIVKRSVASAWELPLSSKVPSGKPERDLRAAHHRRHKAA